MTDDLLPFLNTACRDEVARFPHGALPALDHDASLRTGTKYHQGFYHGLRGGSGSFWGIRGQYVFYGQSCCSRSSDQGQFSVIHDREGPSKILALVMVRLLLSWLSIVLLLSAGAAGQYVVGRGKRWERLLSGPLGMPDRRMLGRDCGCLVS